MSMNQVGLWLTSWEKIVSDNRVVVTDIDMPIGKMMVFMLKWMVASIPVMIIMWVVMAGFALIMGLVLGGFAESAIESSMEVPAE